MPIYEYRCKACQHNEERLQKVSDPAPDVCPSCGKSHTLEKQISHTSFQLKGGGWYKDLYSAPQPATASPSKESVPVKTDCNSNSCNSSAGSCSTDTSTSK